MSIKPIPKKILIHTVTYEEWVEGDGITTEDGFKAPVTLSNVRVQHVSDLTVNTNNKELKYDAILFFDMKNSKASGKFTFVEESKITFEGKEMFIQKVDPVYAFELHHYELGLV
ncbi:putative minor capsid protein [Metabacillus sp. HB246100]